MDNDNLLGLLNSTQHDAGLTLIAHPGVPAPFMAAIAKAVSSVKTTDVTVVADRILSKESLAVAVRVVVRWHPSHRPEVVRGFAASQQLTEFTPECIEAAESDILDDLELNLADALGPWLFDEVHGIDPNDRLHRQLANEVQNWMGYALNAQRDMRIEKWKHKEIHKKYWDLVQMMESNPNAPASEVRQKHLHGLGYTDDDLAAATPSQDA